jgi:hypothetical protein
MVEHPWQPVEAARAVSSERGLSARAAGICRALVPVAALAAVAAYGGHEQDPAAAAEASYLGLLIAALLATVAALAPLPAAELGLGAVVVTAAFWALPPGPLRGAAVALLLLAAWAIALGRRLAGGGPEAATGYRYGEDREGEKAWGASLGRQPAGDDPEGATGRVLGDEESAGGTREGDPERGARERWREARAALAFWLPLAFGAQVLLRGELLFLPEMRWRSLAALLVLPAAGGAALAILARRHGVGRALTAAAAALVLAPGWTVTSTLALAALAAGSWLASVPNLLPLQKFAAATVLISPLLWQPRAGWVAAAAALVLWLPGASRWLQPRLRHGERDGEPSARRARRLLVPPVLLALAGLLILVGLLVWRTPGIAPVPSLCWLALVVPGALLPARPRLALGALLLAMLTPWVPDRSALAAPLALAALALPAGGPAAAPQRVWSAALAGGTALLASYPWLRADPLAAALALLGSPPGPRLAAGVAGAVALLTALSGVAIPRVGPLLRRSGHQLPLFGYLLPRFGLLLPRSSRRLPNSGRRLPHSSRLLPSSGHLLPRFAPRPPAAGAAAVAAAGVAGCALFLALLLALPRPGVPLLARVVPLDGAGPSWETDLSAPAAAASLVVDSSLTHAAGLPGGAPVALVTLRRADGARLSWTLRAGEGTGEWAARRPDVAAAARLRSPAAWLSWVDAGFFAQRYRARWRLPAAGRFVHLRVERAAGLPADLGIALYQLELRP